MMGIHSKHDRTRDGRLANHTSLDASSPGATLLFLSAAAAEQWPWPAPWLQHKPQEPTRTAGWCYIPCSPAAHLLLLLAVLVDRVAAAFELNDSTVDRRLVVVSACTLAAALLLLLLLLMADGQSSHLLLGEREGAAQRQAAPATTRGLPSVERHELRAKSEHRDMRN